MAAKSDEVGHRRKPGRVSGTGARAPGLQSVETSVRVLEVLGEARGPLPLREIGRAAGLGASQAYRYLRSFVQCGLVIQDASSGDYDLGPLALRLGLAALERIDAVEVGGNAVRDLIVRTRTVGGLTVTGSYGPTLVRWYRGASFQLSPIALGTVFTLLGTAVGQLTLAFLPHWQTAGMLERELAGAAPPADLTARLDRIRAMRCATMEGHYAPGLRSIAAPVFDAQGDLVACLALAGLPALGKDQPDPLLEELAALAADVSRRIGAPASAQSPGTQTGA